jgi:Uma2 family endonuclease
LLDLLQQSGRRRPNADERGDFTSLESGDHLDQPTFHARYTAAPEDVKAELIGGVVYMSAALRRPHGRSSGLLLHWLVAYEGETPGVEVYDNTTTILGEDSEPQPDACLIIQPECGGQMRVTEDDYLRGAPELVCEVASSTESYDLHSKKRDYERAGVREYLVIALRQQLLQEFARPETRRQLFDELLQTELFTRRARELGLDREPEYVAARQAVEDSLLASRFQARELAKIQPTDVDLEAFYKLGESLYRQPETLTVRSEELQPDEQAAAVLDGIQSADDFRQWQRKRRGEPAPDEGVSPPETLVRGQPDPRLGNADALFALDAGTWTKEPHEHDGRRFLVLLEGKTPARTPPLDEIRDRVRADYVARKREELSRRLADELMQRYRVKLERWDGGVKRDGVQTAGEEG